jgi:hypothetical protein
MSALQKLPNWAERAEAVRPELDHAIKMKKALTLRTHADMRAARRSFHHRHEVLNLVTPCVIKHDADGRVLRRNFCITAVDARKRPGSLYDAETFPGRSTAQRGATSTI